MANDPESRDSSPGEGDTGTIRAQYDWNAIAPSTAVVETTAKAVNRESTDLESLYASLDPDALDTLLHRNGNTPGLSETSVSFTFAGRRIRVHQTGEVVVSHADDSR